MLYVIQFTNENSLVFIVLNVDFDVKRQQRMDYVTEVMF